MFRVERTQKELFNQLWQCDSSLLVAENDREINSVPQGTYIRLQTDIPTICEPVQRMELINLAGHKYVL
jgi:hypothetical protein